MDGMTEVTPKKSTRTNAYRWIFRGIVFGFLLLVLMFGLVVFAFIRNLTASWTGVGINPFRPIDVAFRPEQPTNENDIIELETVPDVQITPIPWDGKSRISILLLGLDYRDWVERKSAPRSDTMILVSVDPITRQISMLSIPRDLWVEIPGFGHNRINSAYMFGESSRLPGGGPALAMRVVEDLVGVPIQYYAVVNFSTFETMIDEIGGIDVLVKERIKISPIGRMSIWLDPKAHHFNGAEALAYARVRKTSGGDFSRAERQQQVALAILDKVVGAEMIPTLVSKAPKLYQELSSGIRTNLSLEEMISLAWLATSIPKEDYHQGVIAPPSMVGFYTRPDGAQVLRAVTDQIRVLRDQLFVDTSAIGP
jgi:LCP family protein required for cell wall assembly